MVIEPQHNIVRKLRDEGFYKFVVFYLSRRYAGLVDRSTRGFGSTDDYIKRMLECLVSKGLTVTRQRYFSGQMIHNFERIYASVRKRNFEFDGNVFLPLVQALPQNASVLDFGAGKNYFLPAMSRIAERMDITYSAMDYYEKEVDICTGNNVMVVRQPDPYTLPEDQCYDLILLRRVAHHVLDFQLLIKNITDHLKPYGTLVLIEDSYDDQDSSICPESSPMADHELTGRFYQDLTRQQQLDFLRFNDYYSNYLYHCWTDMPLPMNHRTFREWETESAASGIKLNVKFNMGFPQERYNLHQAATGILCFRKLGLS